MAAIVRQAQLPDVPVLCTLVRQYWRFEKIAGFDEQRVGALLSLMLAEPRHGSLWLAVEGEVAVGYLIAVHLLSLEKGGAVAEIDEFYVSESHRGKGIGAAMLAAAEQSLLQRGFRNVALQLGRTNQAARDFYSARGYAPRAGYELFDKDLQQAGAPRAPAGAELIP
jgi:GNAT superfamily N-acetyltransferase